MILFPLYIDPGTGSALFSIAIGIAAASYFLIRALVIKLKVLILRRGGQAARYQYAIYAEDKRYWALFEPVLKELELRGVEAAYFTSSEDDPVFSAGYRFIKGKYIGKGNKAYAFLNFLSADFVLTTTPELDVMQWKRSKTVKHYCHYIHGAGGSLLYRLFSLDYFDSILVPGEVEIPEIRSLEEERKIPRKQLAVVGNSYFDRCAEKIREIPPEKEKKFTVLVSPSWGPSALLKVYGEKLLDPLAETGWRIIVRPHPQSAIVEKPMVDALVEKYKDNPNVEWDYSHENIYAMEKSDIMISDFSGIIYDYVFLFDRPVITGAQNLDFRRLDADDVEAEPYYYKAFGKVGIQLDGENLDSIGDFISSVSRSETLQKNREEVKNTLWQYRGESGKRIADFMINTIERGTSSI